MNANGERLLREVRRRPARAALVSAFVALLVAGCGTYDGSLPDGLNDAPRPLILIVKSEEGIVLVDGSGKLWSFDKSYYFSKTILASDLSSGDTLVEMQ